MQINDAATFGSLAVRAGAGVAGKGLGNAEIHWFCLCNAALTVSPRWGDTEGDMTAVSFSKQKKRFDRRYHILSIIPS